MVQLGRGSGLHRVTKASLRGALFRSRSYELPQVDQFADEERRGMLEQFAAVLVARPKAWSFDRRAGHTDPQVVIPNGGAITVHPAAQRVTVAY